VLRGRRTGELEDLQASASLVLVRILEVDRKMSARCARPRNAERTRDVKFADRFGFPCVSGVGDFNDTLRWPSFRIIFVDRVEVLL
jgi:hypothetical protein